MELSIAKKWYDKGQEEQDKFDKFIYHWIAFNVLYNTEKYSESQRVKAFASKHFVGCVSELKEIIHRSILSEKPIINVYKNRPNIEDFQKLTKDNSINQDFLEALFSTLYTIRCNLFHGDKNPYGRRDEDLARDAGKILEICLSSFLRKIEDELK